MLPSAEVSDTINEFNFCGSRSLLHWAALASDAKAVEELCVTEDRLREFVPT